MNRRVATLLWTATTLLGLAGPAAAEPFLAVRAGAKCSDCHTNLSGGGKRTPFVAMHSRDILKDLDLVPIPSRVRPFTGEVTDFLSIGADLRVRNTNTFTDRPNANGRVSNDRLIRDRVDTVDFDVQEGVGYLQVDLWPDVAMFYLDTQFAPGGVQSREIFGMLQNLPGGLYLKAGKFFPVYGVRIEDDTSFIRSTTGFTFDNPDSGGEFGINRGPFYGAVSITNGATGDRDVLVSTNLYALFQDVPVVENVLAGTSFARLSADKYENAIYVGSKLWKFTWLGEVDLISDNTPGVSPRDHLAAYAELNLLLFDWLNVRGTFDYVKRSETFNSFKMQNLANDQNRFGIELNPFISRFFQPRIAYRAANGPQDDPDGTYNNAKLIFELHTFF